MGVACYGWFEVHDPSQHGLGAPEFPDWWSVIIRLDGLVDRDYDAYGFFFNVYKHPDAAIATRRGLPTKPSEEEQAKALRTWLVPCPQ